MTTGILPVDVAVVGEDPLWVATTMNVASHRIEGVYVREYAAVLQALDHLVAGHPAVLVFAPDALDDVLDHLATVTQGRPELRLVFTTNEDSADAAARLLAETGRVALAEEDPAVGDAIVRLLGETREAATRLGLMDPYGTGAAAQAEADALIVGPDESMRIVAVCSGKGGTGTTSVALNLAAALAAESGSRVTVVDAHGVMGDVGLLLGLPKPDHGRLDDIDIDVDSISRYTVVHDPSELRIVALPHDETLLETLRVRDLLELLIALGPHTDITVIDAPLGLLVASDLVTFANAILLVSTTQLPSLKNTRIAADAIGREAPLHLVLNATIPKAADPGRAQVERFVQVALLGDLPFDDHIATGAASAPAAVLSASSSKFTKRVSEIAEHLLEHSLA